MVDQLRIAFRAAREAAREGDQAGGHLAGTFAKHVERDQSGVLLTGRDQMAKVPLVHRVEGRDPKARRQQAISRGRRTPPLDVAKDREARLEARALGKA